MGGGETWWKAGKVREAVEELGEEGCQDEGRLSVRVFGVFGRDTGILEELDGDAAWSRCSIVLAALESVDDVVRVKGVVGRLLRLFRQLVLMMNEGSWERRGVFIAGE